MPDNVGHVGAKSQRYIMSATGAIAGCHDPLTSPSFEAWH